MVETIKFVGIHVVEASQTRVSQRWCEMDFASIHRVALF